MSRSLCVDDQENRPLNQKTSLLDLVIPGAAPPRVELTPCAQSDHSRGNFCRRPRKGSHRSTPLRQAIAIAKAKRTLCDTPSASHFHATAQCPGASRPMQASRVVLREADFCRAGKSSGGFVCPANAISSLSARPTATLPRATAARSPAAPASSNPRGKSVLGHFIPVLHHWRRTCSTMARSSPACATLMLAPEPGSQPRAKTSG